MLNGTIALFALEEGMATHSSILAWRIPWTGELGGLVIKLCRTLATPWIVAYQPPLSMGFPRQEYWSELLFPSLGDLLDPGIVPGLGRSPGEGNGNPLQYSCLENPMDRGGWWATVRGVAKSQAQFSN